LDDDLTHNKSGHLMMKRTFVSVVFALAANTAAASDLPLGDSASAKVFLQLSGIQQLAAVMDPLLSVPGGAFRIVEGDFLALGNLRIRLAGIDAPEIAQRCNTAQGMLWECAAQAEDRMRDILRAADRVECFSNDQDNYGYYVASCKADGADIGAQLVSEGLAWADETQGYYQAEAARAQAASLGIWQAETASPSEWRRAHK
jgi:endonuclease YncB( thermonuclease family)